MKKESYKEKLERETANMNEEEKFVYADARTKAVQMICVIAAGFAANPENANFNIAEKSISVWGEIMEHCAEM